MLPNSAAYMLRDMRGFLVVGGGYAAVIGSLIWIAIRVRRSGVGGSVLGVFDEIYHPDAHGSRLVIQVLEQRGVSMPSPDDHYPPPPGIRSAQG
jgi:hypothetical protein